jgi:hypothetical protein
MKKSLVENLPKKVTSDQRPNKLFTADHDLILYKVGSIGKSIHEKVVNQLIQIFSL